MHGEGTDVTARINRGEMVFNDIPMRALFLAFVTRLKKKHSFAIYNFCVMGNHIHFAIRPNGDSSLSEIMQWLGAQRLWEIMRRRGIRRIGLGAPIYAQC